MSNKQYFLVFDGDDRLAANFEGPPNEKISQLKALFKHYKHTVKEVSEDEYIEAIQEAEDEELTEIFNR